MTKVHEDEMIREGGILPVSDLKGRAVWDEAGHRVGTLRNVETNGDGRIVALDVQRRWILGPHDRVDATGMRLEGNDIIVPQLAVPSTTDDTVAASPRPDAPSAPAPMLVAGREGARARHGGISPISGLMGALVAIATCLLVGGVLFEAADTGAFVFDLKADTDGLLTTSSLWMAVIALGVGAFLGGVTAGRAARFDGVRNGLLVPVWAAVICGLFAAAGGLFGDQYNIIASLNLPNFEFGGIDNWAVIGIVTMLIAFGVMLVAGAIGGMLGELWQRRSDRTMLEPVAFGASSQQRTGEVTTVPLATGMQSSPVGRTEPALTDPAGSNATNLRQDAVYHASPAMPQPLPRRDDPTR
ncbi:MAG: hypothetical protein JWN72_1097 [Thermoleophilia bacterium]|nr:hypothetical protein [Thermoleophilia bacterium]